MPETILIFPMEILLIATVLTAGLMFLAGAHTKKSTIASVILVGISATALLWDWKYGSHVSETYTPIWQNVKESKLQHSPTHRSYSAEQEVTCRWESLVSYKWSVFLAKYEKVDHEGVNCSQLRVLHEENRKNDV